MSCGNCVKHTTEALEKVDGVTSVNVDLDTHSAVVESGDEIRNEVLESAVNGAGYTVVSIS
jgi:copper chaperone CopZ